MAQLLIVDDEKVLAESLCMLFRDEGHQTSYTLCAKDAINIALAKAPDVILLDLRLPDLSGLEVLKTLKPSLPNTMVIMMTAHGDTATVVEAVKNGAFHYLNKPFELDEITMLVNKALEQQQLRDEVMFLRERQSSQGGFDGMVGTCPAMQKAFETIRLVAGAGDSAVLISGESGTGKELVASALHQLSPRQSQPFAEVNCAAIPENLLESEMFGYEKGAFTDAGKRKKGLVELAQNGTLFLDEIGEMPLHLQAKLLRFLEKRTFRRVGGTLDLNVNARIIAATNQNLHELVQQRKFREDLFYRLNVVPVQLPPLRERGQDIMLLAEHFLTIFGQRFGQPAKQLSAQAEKAFLTYSWPGNVRELKNMIERLVILCPTQEVALESLPGEMVSSIPGSSSLGQMCNIDDQLLEIERQLVCNALQKAHGKRSDAAEFLGISRHALKRKMQKLQLADHEDG